jgi:hypothetical protein
MSPEDKAVDNYLKGKSMTIFIPLERGQEDTVNDILRKYQPPIDPKTTYDGKESNE